jgi:asparagine synthase (glutamine-hydrolysing)
MCGILAVLGMLKGTASKRKTEILKSVARLRHRGPDWYVRNRLSVVLIWYFSLSSVFSLYRSGSYTSPDGTCMICHERLSIVGVESGAQPLYSADRKQILAVNGEIYNHTELKQEPDLEPVQFATKSDCEVILHMLRCITVVKGNASISITNVHDQMNRLSGMFAFVYLDESTNTLIIGRDHLGIIPLYIGYDSTGALWVASELKALYDTCVYFTEFPTGSVMITTISSYKSPDSLTKSISKWYNPEWMIQSASTYVPQINELASKHEQNLGYYKGAVATALEKSVVSHMMTDVPYGVLLSGGLDSFVVSAIAAKHAQKRIEDNEKSDAWWPKLHTFSIGLKDSPDLKYAREAAAVLKTQHHEFHFTVEEGLNAISDVIWHLETFDITTIRAGTPMYLLARKVKAMGVKMVLSGEGSDELFGGYLYYHKAPNAEEFFAENVRQVRDAGDVGLIIDFVCSYAMC